MDIKEVKSGLTEENCWHKAKSYLIYELLSKIKKKSMNILDIGAGTGSDIKVLNKFGKLTVVDSDKKALELINKSFYKKKLVCDATKIPLKDGSFDLIVAFDVFEHIKNDNEVISECKRLLNKGGFLIFTVPAFMWLFSSYDTSLDHFRRYNKRDIF